jgi:SurA N-terminal domain
VKRVVLVAAVVALALVGVGIAALLRDDDGGKTVATVSGHRITSEDLTLAVEHFHEEADREGHDFPAKGTKEYEQVEKLALRLLIDRAAIEAAASRLGVHVTDAQVEAHLARSPPESEGGGDVRIKAEAAFRRATARNQLITVGVFQKLTAGIRVAPSDVRNYYRRNRALYASAAYAEVAHSIASQLLAQRKNAALAHWLTQVRRSEPKT